MLIKVMEIPLDATSHQIKTTFGRYGMIVRFNMETINMWQQATITYAPNTNFVDLKKCNGVFVLNDMVRIHMCNLSGKEIREKSKYSAKLAGLPRNTTGKQLIDIAKMVHATAWVIPKARSNYHNLQHAFFYFESNDDVEAAISNENLTIDGKHVIWTSSNTKLCAICSSPNHKASDCPKRRKRPADRNMQNLYQRFQPAQFSNYKAPPKKLAGAVTPNITFAHMTKGPQNGDQTITSNNHASSPKQQSPTNNNNQKRQEERNVAKQMMSWSDDISTELDNDYQIDQLSCPTPKGNLFNGTRVGGSMHDNSANFEEFVKQQFSNLAAQMSTLVNSLAFTVKRVESMEQSLNIKVVTPL
jgi:hypothetical protein